MGIFSKSKHSNQPSNILPIETEEFKLTPSGEKSSIHAPHTLTAEEVMGKPKKTPRDIKMSGGVSPLEQIKQKSMKNSQKVHKESTTAMPSETAVPKTTYNKALFGDNTADSGSLLEKCMPFIKDAQLLSEPQKPAYKLPSVDAILSSQKAQTDELLKKLSSFGTVTVDNLNKAEPKSEPKEINPEAEAVTEFKPKEEPVEIEMKSEDLSKTRVIPTISDIDNASSPVLEAVYEDISSGTKIIDLSAEMFETDEGTDTSITDSSDILQEDDFFVVDDYNSFEDAQRIGGKLTKSKNGARAKLIFTLIFSAALGIFSVPAIYDLTDSSIKSFPVIIAAVYALICLINLDMFTAIKALFKKRVKPKAAVGVAAAITLIYAIISAVTDIIPLYVVLFSCLLICFKALSDFWRAKYMLSNFKVIANRYDKYAVTFISDRQITFAMAKNSISGDVLVGCPNKTQNILDYVKYSTVSTDFDSRFNPFFITAFICAVATAIISALYRNDFSSLLGLLSVNLGIVFGPSLLLTDVLPLYRASRKLNRQGAMISGTNMARMLDTANAVTLTSEQLFPAGTVTLFNMKVLDSNKIDTTLLDAAAITKMVNSPLYPMFENIIKTQNAELPKADSVKYEETLGISGWVANRRVFIGNRTLLEARGISVPPIAVDRKILQQGYFPLYVACNDVPCALLIVKYNVRQSLAHELQKLCNSGVTVLIDSCDPNLTNEMVCDYFGLPVEAIRVMGSSGAQLYKAEIEPQESISAGAAYRISTEGYLSVFNCASRIRRSVKFMTMLHMILSFCMLAANIYATVLNNTDTILSGVAYLYVGVITVGTLIAYLFNRP